MAATRHTQDARDIPGFLQRVDRLRAVTGLSDGRVSRIVFGSGDQIDRMRAGCTITVDRLARGFDALAALEVERGAEPKRRRALAALASLENEHRNSPGRQPGDASSPRRRTTNARAK